MQLCFDRLVPPTVLRPCGGRGAPWGVHVIRFNVKWLVRAGHAQQPELAPAVSAFVRRCCGCRAAVLLLLWWPLCICGVLWLCVPVGGCGWLRLFAIVPFVLLLPWRL